MVVSRVPMEAATRTRNGSHFYRDRRLNPNVESLFSGGEGDLWTFRNVESGKTYVLLAALRANAGLVFNSKE